MLRSLRPHGLRVSDHHPLPRPCVLQFPSVGSLVLNFLEMFLKNRLRANIIIFWVITLLFMKMLNFLIFFEKQTSSQYNNLVSHRKMLNFLEMFLKNRLRANIIILWVISLLFMKMFNFLNFFLKNRLRANIIILWAITRWLTFWICFWKTGYERI